MTYFSAGCVRSGTRTKAFRHAVALARAMAPCMCTREIVRGTMIMDSTHPPAPSIDEVALYQWCRSGVAVPCNGGTAVLQWCCSCGTVMHRLLYMPTGDCDRQETYIGAVRFRRRIRHSFIAWLSKSCLPMPLFTDMCCGCDHVTTRSVIITLSCNCSTRRHLLDMNEL
jgi:hypothetical protein